MAMLLRDFLYDIHKARKCLLAANFYNLETLKGILQAAKQAKAPIILQASQGTIRFIGLRILVDMVRAAIKEYEVMAWLHLDHGSDLELIKQALDAGFDSVMIDASDKDFEQNIAITSQVVKMAEPFGVNVEAELGYVPKLGDKQKGYGYTDVEQAVEFVERTGINALAIAVGTAHGFYKQTPRLSYERISQIRAAVDVPLVLHGASGLSSAQLRKAIKAGISKINIATEIKATFTKALRSALTPEQIDPRNYLPQTIGAVSKLIYRKLKIITK